MYLLALLPTLTDLLEHGGFADSPRGWITEILVGLVIIALVHGVRLQYRTVLALATTDALTGLWNRHSFETAIEDECARARRSGQTLSLVYVDLDNFKEINDRLGHDAGDRVLRQLAAAIGEAIREHIDRSFRVGGDEFTLLLPGSSADQAQGVVTRIRALCVRSDPVWVEGRLAISAGIVQFDPQETTDEFMRRADDVMYRQKKSSPGRDTLRFTEGRVK